ncbi:MAG TPA: ATP-binding protein [Thermotogota bacterium]|nr:ATP-binding protein [Thermotogota bacterium]
MIERQIYMQKLKDFKDMQIIKVITGIRRCGKSTFLLMFQEFLKQSGVKRKNIISINFEDLAFAHLQDYKELYQYILSKINDSERFYIFLDEIQNVENFQKAVDSLFLKTNLDIYLTGSNANMLSSEISTLLSGRYVEVQMLPLSFKEYVSSKDDPLNLNRLYSEYLQNSSFPMSLQMKTREQVDAYLQGVYNTVIMKDILSRNRISDPMMLESVIRFMFDNIGNILSTKKIADTMTSAGRKIDIRTVESYISALMNAFVVYQAKRYDIKGKQYLKTLEKYYVVDIGLRYNLLGFKNVDFGHILENVVYLELIRRGYRVYVGKIGDLEIDFVAENQQGLHYFQVSATVRDSRTLERELKPLKKLRDSYPKFVLTLDEDPERDFDGIRVMNALDFLVN